MALARALSKLRNIASRLGEREIGALVALLLIVVGALVFIQVADLVIDGQTGRFDEWAMRAMRHADDLSIPIGPHWLPGAARDITALGSSAVVLLVIFASVGYLIVSGKYR